MVAGARRRLEHVDRADPRRPDPRLLADQPGRLLLGVERPQHRHGRLGAAGHGHRDDLRDHHRGHRPVRRLRPRVRGCRLRQGDGQRQQHRHDPRRPGRRPARRPGVGRDQRLPDRQGEDPAVHRHARHLRHRARRRAADHRRRRRARGPDQADHRPRHGPARRDPVAGGDRRRGLPDLRDHPRADAIRPLHVRRGVQPGGRAARGREPRPPPDQGLRADGHARGARRVHERWPASGRPRSAATPRTT